MKKMQYLIFSIFTLLVLATYHTYLAAWKTKASLNLRSKKDEHLGEETKETFDMQSEGAENPFPSFITYAVEGTTHIGTKERWNRQDMRKALRLMYSSLVRTHTFNNQPPLLYVYTNIPSSVLTPITTTFATPTNIITRPYTPIQTRYKSAWKALLRSKLDIVLNHLSSGERVVWIDLDTLVLDTLPFTVSWVIGWEMGHATPLRNMGDLWVQPRSQAQGDIWFINEAIARRIIDMEQGLKVLPAYDLQGVFSIMLEQNIASLVVLQDIWNRSVGFKCSVSNIYRLPTCC